MSIEQAPQTIEPIITIRIKPKNYYEIDNLFDDICKIIKANQTASFQRDRNSIEYILGGTDIREIDKWAKKINSNFNVDISQPRVLYRTTIFKKNSGLFARLNPRCKIEYIFEPLDEKTENLILSKQFILQNNIEEQEILLCEEANWDEKEARKLIDVYHGCLLINNSTLIKLPDKMKCFLIESFREWVITGISFNTWAIGIKVVITKIDIKESPEDVEINPNERLVFRMMNPLLDFHEIHILEPTHEFKIRVNSISKKTIIGLIKKHRGKISKRRHRGGIFTVEGTIPTAEFIEIYPKIENETKIRGFIHSRFLKFEKLPEILKPKIIVEISEDKKLKKITNKWDSKIVMIGGIDELMKTTKDKITSTMQKQETNVLTLERSYLFEFTDLILCEQYHDCPPKLMNDFESFLQDFGITVLYKGDMIVFIKMP